MPMGEVERGPDFAQHAEHERQLRSPPGPADLLQRATAHERHHEERDPRARVELVHRDDVGVRERRGEGRLTLESGLSDFTRGDVRREHLDRHDVTEGAMPCGEHGSHPTRPGERQDLVAVADGALDVFRGGDVHEQGQI
jgi:hypothetical protein